MKLRLILFTVAICGVFLLAACEKQQPKRPNFLFVLVDDQSPFDLKKYDPNSILETPNIDRLAECKKRIK